MICKYFVFFIAIVYGTTQPLQSSDSKSLLEKMQEQIISHYLNQASKSFELTEDLIVPITSKKFLQTMNQMDDNSFIIFWDSYRVEKSVASKVTGRNLIKEVIGQKGFGKLFENMKKIFEYFMYKRLVKQFAFPVPEISDDNEELLLEAMTLYHGKFRSIWMRMAEPGSEKFDDLSPMFANIRQTINLGIHGSLDYVFGEILRNLNRPENKELVFNYKKHFAGLVDLLSTEKKENFGLRWVADHEDPFFILSYFYYQKYIPNPTNTILWYIINKDQTQTLDFYNVFLPLRVMTNHEINLKNRRLIFEPGFKSPFPPNIMGDEEFKIIIIKIVSKLWIFKK
jgi:hypothetical protein